MRGVGRVFVHLDIDLGIEADVDGARVNEATPAPGAACADEVLDAANIGRVRRPSIRLGGGAPSEQRKLGRSVKDGIDPFARLDHSVGVLEFAPNDFQVRVLELQRCISDHRANPITLGEKTSHQVTTEKAGGAGDETGPEIVQWFVRWHVCVSLYQRAA